MVIAQTVAYFHCPRYAELPNLLLYMDQVLIILNDTLAPLCPLGEAAATSTMINNYVKQKLLPPPVKKKYGREQLSLLIMICVLKRVFSISEIAALNALPSADTPEQRYDAFCEELEGSLCLAFRSGLAGAELGELSHAPLHAALVAFAAKLAVQDALVGCIQI